MVIGRNVSFSIPEGVTYVISIVWYILVIASAWKIFVKMGAKGWKALIPLYNVYVEFSYTWKKEMAYWLCALQIIGAFAINSANETLSLIGAVASLAGFVLYVIGQNKLSKSFGHGKGFTVGLVILNPIFNLILGFGKSEYIGKPAD